MPLVFVPRHAALDEGLVIGGNSIEMASVAHERRQATHLKPSLWIDALKRAAIEHNLVVAAKKSRLVRPLKLDEKIDCSAAIGTAIDVVAQENQHVFWTRIDGRDQRTDRLTATVNITDGDRAH